MTLYAKDIRDADMLAVIAAINDNPPSVGPGYLKTGGRWAFTRDIFERFEPFPPKVVLAKARALIKRRLMDGCGCGCRGDFEVLAKGRELLASCASRRAASSTTILGLRTFRSLALTRDPALSLSEVRGRVQHQTHAQIKRRKIGQ
jgi:hypothetical protein